ncbi:MAG: oligosaccharide flippase family protein [Prevotella sp.]|nr:oligosaccharide flippase family protein [Prevotella sp.]
MHNIPIADSAVKSKRIASNTVVLFVRMFAVMVINLYAVRVILRALGEVDYGLFNTISGVVLTSSFLVTTLAVSIQRFYSYALGEHNNERLSHIFTASTNIILVLTLLLIVVLETIGIWFVETQLTIPSDRVTTVHWLFQFSILTLTFSFMQVPYTAAIFAHERMGAFAVVSLLECLGRLLVALLIGKVVTSDGLLFYGAGLLVVAFLVFTAYATYSRSYFAECHYASAVDRKLYKELLSFSGWTTYSAISGMSIVHGNTILLNIYFGPVATASYAIANQIHNAITALGNSIAIAFRPAMVKSYAEKAYSYLDKLFYVCNKSLLYLLLCVSVPLILEMPIILNWWLAGASAEMTLFSRLFVVFMLLLIMQNPITTIIQASGEIKYYTLLVDSIILLCLPLTWMLYHFGAPGYSCFLVMLFVFCIAHAVRLVCLHRQYPTFSYMKYLQQIVLPGGVVCALSLSTAWWLHRHIDTSVAEFFTVVAVTPIVTLLAAYAIGLTRQEREMLNTYTARLFKRKGL